MRAVTDQVTGKSDVWDRFGGRSSNPMWDLWFQVWGRVWAQVGDRVQAQVRSRVHNQA